MLNRYVTLVLGILVLAEIIHYTMDFPNSKPEILTIFGRSESAFGFHDNSTSGESTQDLDGNWTEATSQKPVHEHDPPITDDSLGVTASSDSVMRGSLFEISARVTAHRTGNVDTDWQITMIPAAGYSITDSEHVKTVTTHAHGSARVSWVLYSPSYPSLSPDLFAITATAFDSESDDQLSGSPTTKTLSILTVNIEPNAGDDMVSTDEDTPIEIHVLVNDNDVDNDTLHITGIIEQPQNGTIVPIINESATSIIYDPNQNFFGNDQFTYEIQDGYNGTASAVVSVLIISVNDAPVPIDDDISTLEDTSVIIPVTSNDYDVDGGDGVMRVVAASAPANGTTAIADGELDNTVIVYTPSNNFEGADAFTYVISDGFANSTGNVNVSVTPVNDAPIAKNSSVTTNEDQSIEITLNACDPEGTRLGFRIVTTPIYGMLASITPVGLAAANVTYTPGMNYYGTDSFTFRASDGELESLDGTVNISINPDPSDDGVVPSTDDGEADDKDTGIQTSRNYDSGGSRKGNASTVTGRERSYDVSLANYTITTQDGRTVTCIPLGDTGTFSYIIRNYSLLDYDCIFIWELIDQDNVVQDIKVFHDFIPRIDMIVNEVDWHADTKGKYVVRLLILDSLESPSLISEATTQRFEVKEN
jgi:Big-like domain-containing protein